MANSGHLSLVAIAMIRSDILPGSKAVLTCVLWCPYGQRQATRTCQFAWLGGPGNSVLASMLKRL
ncbi:hypothetical protein IAQ61_007048, partial [Plenodomus lingam]